MKFDLPKAYSDFYGKILTNRYRREFLRFLRDNQPAALARVMKDHRITLQQFNVIV